MHRPTFFWYNGRIYFTGEYHDNFEELKARGLILQTTDEEALVKAFEEGPVSYYTGYDLTADSLHLGHLVAIILQVADFNWLDTNLTPSLVVQQV